MHYGTNVGYAIKTLERQFYEVGLALAGGDPSLIHFAYPDLDGGQPDTLPSDFRNLLTFKFRTAGDGEIKKLSEYVRSHGITFIMVFDMQPLHPICRPLREAGATVIVSYIGGPVSSLMPFWKLMLKRLEVICSGSKVDGMIFESKAMANLAILGRGIPSRMADVVPLGVDIARFRPDRSDYPYQAFDFPRDRKIIYYSGHADRRKGVHILIKAARELLETRGRTDLCFLLCGNKDDESRPFEAMYAGGGLEPYIRFGGYRTDLDKIAPGCFCGVIPSVEWDSYTMSSLEMAASGLPVVASDLQGLAEAVVDGKTGLLFEPGNPIALADAIDRLRENPAEAASLGGAGRIRVENELSLNAQQGRILDAIRARFAANGITVPHKET